MKFRPAFICFLFITLSISIVYAQVDDTKAASARLEDTGRIFIQQLKTAPSSQKYGLLKKMLRHGFWEEAFQSIQRNNYLSESDQHLLLAYYYWLNNYFQESERHTNLVLQHDPTNLDALKIKSTLLIEAWKLQEATDLCYGLLRPSIQDPEISLILGRALLLQRHYDKALALAKELQERYPQLAAAYLLEANVYFWDQHPEKATPLIIKALELDPFDADARFSYGYAIWRRVDATQLDQMAAQWELALAINPLHFQTHWHWGNGHTNLTFTDYADPQEEEIRKKLEPADSLVRQNCQQEALILTKQITKNYPSSVLPLMHQASIYYNSFDVSEREKMLDSAEVIFRQILNKKPHYGPAHNGLSAVIKSKRIPYLSTYDSIKTALKHIKISDLDNFEIVFPDVTYYPGNLAKAMVWNQLYTSTVYFPFLAKQGNTFVIPPLHQDLAIAMKRPFFRSNTTFDNRQWMDIRGVGSGAAAIEYVERGAYQERNVILHEYVHLFHGRVLTDQENRRIRSLYYNAMKNKRTLDYYSQNNESEYFAQTYPAYFETVKVHPLDFKSMNTRAALISKDPDMYHFLDSLIHKEKSYLAGNKKAMASNWSEVYINLSNQVADSLLAGRLLDTALLYDKDYQPAYLAYARLKIKQKKWKEARALLEAAKDIDSTYAPTYQALAEWEAQQPTHASITDREAGVERQAKLLKKALTLESDYQTSAYLATALRSLYDQQGKIGLAVEAADTYVRTGAEISTYLRDKKDEARIYAATKRALLGDSTQLRQLDHLAKQKPQNFELQLAYAKALTYHKLFKKSNKQLLRVQKILTSNQHRNIDFDLQIAENYLALNQHDSVSFYLSQATANKNLSSENKLVVLQLLLKSNRLKEAKILLKEAYEVQTPQYHALKYYTKGLLHEKQGEPTIAIANYKQSLMNNPYLMEAYEHLTAIYAVQGNQGAVDKLKKQRASLFMP
jgi:predicted Zn-dependent protease